MSKRSLRLILPVFAALGVACGSDPCCGPAPRVFTTLEVTPTDAAIFTVAPGNTLRLAIWAFDQTGAPMPGTDRATYTSNALWIARVNSSGVVTAYAPGTAVITAAVTLGGITRTASMTVTVYVRDYSDILGVYDLTALVTSFDSSWGEDFTGYRYTAVLTLAEEWGPPWVGGTFANVRFIGPGGDSSLVADAGVVSYSLDYRGRARVELLGDGNHTLLILLVNTLAAGFIDGTFGSGSISGTFTATRRQPK